MRVAGSRKAAWLRRLLVRELNRRGTRRLTRLHPECLLSTGRDFLDLIRSTRRRLPRPLPLPRPDARGIPARGATYHLRHHLAITAVVGCEVCELDTIAAALHTPQSTVPTSRLGLVTFLVTLAARAAACAVCPGQSMGVAENRQAWRGNTNRFWIFSRASL